MGGGGGFQKSKSTIEIKVNIDEEIQKQRVSER